MRRMYLVQIERLRRLCKFITADNKFKSLEVPLQIDMILSFFIHCYHLSDWLKKSGVDEGKVNSYVSSTYELQVCRNLANGTKHLELSKPSPPQVFDWNKANLPGPIVRTYDPFGKELGYSENEYLSILVDGQELQCGEFMKRCIVKWENFLEKEKLPKAL